MNNNSVMMKLLKILFSNYFMIKWIAIIVMYDKCI